MNLVVCALKYNSTLFKDYIDTYLSYKLYNNVDTQRKIRFFY